MEEPLQALRDLALNFGTSSSQALETGNIVDVIFHGLGAAAERLASRLDAVASAVQRLEHDVTMGTTVCGGTGRPTQFHQGVLID